MTSQTHSLSQLGYWIVAGALALSLASCRGSSSDQPGQDAAKVDRPQSAEPLSVEWTDADLEKNASRNGYGKKPASILARAADGALVFTPETVKDHVSTQFVGLAAYDGDRSLELSLDMKSPGGETCVANLQDQAYNVLATVPCRTAGEQRTTAKVASTVTGVRVYFLSASAEPLRLPARMRLVEHR
jgi:hypothetical protein